jgi:uncharacterized membrane protein
MSLPGTILIWATIIIFLTLFVLAIAHVIQGWRFAHGDRQILIATLVFVLVFTIIVGTSAILLRNINWQQPWSFSQTIDVTEDSL